MTRRAYAIATAATASLFAASFVAIAILDPLPRLIWNASASAPIGLYKIDAERDPPPGALVAVAPPAPLSRWLSGRGYLPEGVPLLKHVAAKPGQRVCRIGAVVSVDARPIAVARARDSLGRPLPVWRGCRTLRPGELLLLNPAHPDSMDGRYFGPLPASTVRPRCLPAMLPTRRLRGATVVADPASCPPNERIIPCRSAASFRPPTAMKASSRRPSSTSVSPSSRPTRAMPTGTGLAGSSRRRWRWAGDRRRLERERRTRRRLRLAAHRRSHFRAAYPRRTVPERRRIFLVAALEPAAATPRAGLTPCVSSSAPPP